MSKQEITAIQISNGGRLVPQSGHWDEGDVLIVGTDIQLEDARMFVRNGLAVPSTATETKRAAAAPVVPAPKESPAE